MSISLSDYRDMFPEHADVADVDVARCIGFAESDVGSTYLGSKIDRARLYYAAHFVEADYVSPSSLPRSEGPVKSKSADGFSVSFDVGVASAPTSSDFSSTKYGQRYAHLVRRNCGPVEMG